MILLETPDSTCNLDILLANSWAQEAPTFVIKNSLETQHSNKQSPTDVC